MKRFLLLGLAAVLVASLNIPFGLAGDDRKILVVPEKARTKFLKEMRGHLGSFDEIFSAVAEGDFKEAARIAESHMNFGPNIWIEMASRGMSPDKIAKLRKRYQGMSLADQQKLINEIDVPRKVHLPGSFDNTVQLFYSATGNFADIAKNVGDEPTLDDYENVIAALREIISICRGCHTAYQLE